MKRTTATNLEIGNKRNLNWTRIIIRYHRHHHRVSQFRAVSPGGRIKMGFSCTLCGLGPRMTVFVIGTITLVSLSRLKALVSKRASAGGDVFSPLYSSYSEVLFTLTGCGIENASLVAFGRKTRSKILGRINRKAIARGHPGCRMHGKGFVFVFHITSLSYLSLLFFFCFGGIGKWRIVERQNGVKKAICSGMAHWLAHCQDNDYGIADCWIVLRIGKGRVS